MEGVSGGFLRARMMNPRLVAELAAQHDLARCSRRSPATSSDISNHGAPTIHIG
jgi:hypothetical protein